MSHTLKYFILLDALIEHPIESVNDYIELKCTVAYMHTYVSISLNNKA